MLDTFAQKNKHLLHSIAVVFGWFMVMTAAFALLLPIVFLLFTEEKILGLTLLIAFGGFFAVGYFTIKEKPWSYIGWSILTLALIYMMLSIPFGMQLAPVALISLIVSCSAYLGFASKETAAPNNKHLLIVGVLFVLVFGSHALILENPAIIGLTVQGDEFGKTYREGVQYIGTMDPMEFIESSEGRKRAIEAYNLPLLTSDTELREVVAENPEPIREAQQEFLSTTPELEESVYTYIMSIYSYPTLKLLVIEQE